MLYLQNLVTNKTPILELYNDLNITDEMKYAILGVQKEKVKKRHIKMMYKKDSSWYYYKVERKSHKYPYYLIDELMGSYLSKKKGILTVLYNRPVREAIV